MVIFETQADKMGIEITEIRKARWFQRLFSINRWTVIIKYKGKKLKLLAWAGINDPSLDNIYYSVVGQIQNMEKVKKFNIDIAKYVPQEKSE